MKRATLVLVALALLLGGVGQTRADFVYFGTARVYGDDARNIPFDTGLVSGVPTLSTPVSATAQGDGVSGQAYAGLVTVPGGFTWQLTAAAQTDPNLPINVAVISEARWVDALTLSNTDPLLVGQTLRLNFMSSGSFTGGSWPLQHGATVGAVGQNTSDSGIPAGAANTSVAIGYDGIEFQNSPNWDSLSIVGGSYTGTWHLDIPFIPGAGNRFNFGVFDQVSESEGDGNVEDPSGFLSITLPDVGNVTPESLGVSLTFASGIVSPNLQPSATAAPEPASFTLLGIGAAGLLGYGWRRRKQVQA
jgi:hypothetical protein